jgi:chromosome segregation ATPase
MGKNKKKDKKKNANKKQNELARKDVEIDEAKEGGKPLENADSVNEYGYSPVDFRKKLEEQIENAQKDAEKIRDDLATWQTQLEETKKTIAELENLKVKEGKLKSDSESLQKQIKSVDHEVSSLKGQLNNSSREKPEESKKGSPLESLKRKGKKPAGQAAQSDDFSLPQLERLPFVGELYQCHGQSYLAITYWEDYDKGKTEAERLKAKLCAKGEK